MAARLPVVVSQSARREPTAIACEENLITELLFTAGLDATLIGPLESIQSGSTDHLCLEGLKGAFALLSWVDATESRQQLSRLEIHGTIVDRSGKSPIDTTLASPLTHDSDRAIDCFQLSPESSPASLIEQLKQILEARDIKAFPIMLPGRQAARRSIPSIAQSVISAADELSRNPPSESKFEIKPLPPLTTIDLDGDDEAWVHLDTLMDDLDRSDV